VPPPDEPPHPDEPPPPVDPHDVSQPEEDTEPRPGQHQPPDPEAWVRHKRLNRIVAMHETAEQFYRYQLAGSWVPEYLRGRGLAELLDQPQLGYAPSGPRALVDHIRAHDYTDEEILEAGLASMSHHGNRIIDRFRDRMMLTIRAEHPDKPGTTIPVAMAGRAAPTADKKVPKYLNTAATAAYEKSTILYGLAENADLLRAGATPVLVEGYLDTEAITLATGGRAVGLASGGTALTEDQVAALGNVVDLQNTAVVVATDNDHAGRVAATRAWHLLVDAGVTNPRAADLGDHKDPADVLRYDGEDALTTAVTATTSPLLNLVVDHKLDQWGPAIGDNPFAEISALRSIAPHIARADTAQQVEATVRLYARLMIGADTIQYELDQYPDGEPGSGDHAGSTPASDQSDVADVDARPGVAGVKGMLRAALADPLPDDHPAAALWSRINVLATAIDRVPSGAPPAERQLLDIVSIPAAAAS
jgi:DNA primase catalytic core